MILHPGILALLFGSTLVTILVVVAAIHAVRILLFWDSEQYSERQLSLERSTHLISSITSVALWFEVAALAVFILILDLLHPLFPGAMCATGTLNANPVGWWVLGVKIVLFFCAGSWILLQNLNRKLETPLHVKSLNGALLLISPLFIFDLIGQVLYFEGLNPEVITSCCGSLFSQESEGVASIMVSLPVRSSMMIFFPLLAIFAGSGLWATQRRTRQAILIFSFLGVFVFVGSILSTVSFISLYIYQMPTHHCPFDFFQIHYGAVGYLYYGLLLYGALHALVCGILAVSPAAVRIPLLNDTLGMWMKRSMIAIFAFSVLVVYFILRGDFTLKGYLL